jgi:hypothetical protein
MQFFAQHKYRIPWFGEFPQIFRSFVQKQNPHISSLTSYTLRAPFQQPQRTPAASSINQRTSSTNPTDQSEIPKQYCTELEAHHTTQ